MYDNNIQFFLSSKTKDKKYVISINQITNEVMISMLPKRHCAYHISNAYI